MPDWLLALGPIAAFIGGYLFKYVGRGLDSRWTSKREKAARDAEHDRALRERRETFELDSLGNLNATLRKLDQAASEVMFAHRHGLRGSSVEVNQYVVSSELGWHLSAMGADARVQAELLLDEDLRRAVVNATYGLDYGYLFASTSLEELDRKHKAGSEHLRKAREMTSARIRGIYLAWDIPLEASPKTTALESPA